MPLHADVDDDRRALIVNLRTQVGMLMEDTSSLVLTARSVTNENLADRVDEIDIPSGGWGR